MQIWLQKLLPQHLISRLVGKLAKVELSWLKNFLIKLFIQQYKIDMSEADPSDYQQYPSFNKFFIRPLKPNVRSMPEEAQAIACPVDGFISELGMIQDQQLLQAKGHQYDLETLLGADVEMASSFKNGAFLTAYLSPKDYHRVHMPTAGALKKMIHVPGSLFSVNPYTVTHVEGLFAQNERVICYFDTAHGPMAMIMVGAIIVASIAMAWHGIVTPPSTPNRQEWDYQAKPIELKRGDEMGHFELGSTVIVLFSENKMQWDADLNSDSTIRLGQAIGEFL